MNEKVPICLVHDGCCTLSRNESLYDRYRNQGGNAD